MDADSLFVWPRPTRRVSRGRLHRPCVSGAPLRLLQRGSRGRLGFARVQRLIFWTVRVGRGACPATHRARVSGIRNKHHHPGAWNSVQTRASNGERENRDQETPRGLQDETQRRPRVHTGTEEQKPERRGLQAGPQAEEPAGASRVLAAGRHARDAGEGRSYVSEKLRASTPRLGILAAGSLRGTDP